MKTKIIYLLTLIIFFSLVGCSDNKELDTDQPTGNIITTESENNKKDVISTQDGKLLFPNKEIPGFEQEDYLIIYEDIKRIDKKYNGIMEIDPKPWDLCNRITKVMNGSHLFCEVNISNNVIYIAGYHESYIGGDVENPDEITYVISDNLEGLTKAFNDMGRCSLYIVYSVNSVKELLESNLSDNKAFYYAAYSNDVNDLSGNYLMCLLKSDLNNYSHFVLEEEIYSNRYEIFEYENNKFIKLEMTKTQLEFEFEGYSELRNVVEEESDFYKLALLDFIKFLTIKNQN